MSNHVGQIARELRLARRKVAAVLELLEKGNAAPFIARFRQTETGGLDEARVRDIELRVRQLSALADRKRAILKLLQSRQVLTTPLAEAIEAAPTPKRLEELYAPWRTQRQSLADAARAQGWQPLAERILQEAESQSTLEQVAASFLAEQAATRTTAAEPTTAEPTTAEPTTAEPTTAEPTTAEPTTAEPTTAEPTTAEPLSLPSQPLLNQQQPSRRPLRRRSSRRWTAPLGSSPNSSPAIANCGWSCRVA